MAESTLSKLAETYSWPRDMRTEARDIMHALGVAQYRFVHLEFALDWLISIYLNFGSIVGRAITGNMGGNQSKTDALRIIVGDQEKDAEVAASIIHGLACFDLVRENRNSITHGILHFFRVREQDVAFDPHMARVKAKGNVSFSEWPISAAIVRKVADETLATDRYIRDLVMFIARRRHLLAEQLPLDLTLPKKPAPPSKLMTPHQGQQGGQPRQKSSQPKGPRLSSQQRRAAALKNRDS